MKEKQFIKLSVEVSKVFAAASLHSSRIKEFTPKTTNIIKDIQDNIDLIHSELIRNPTLETAQKFKSGLENIKSSLKRDVEQPVMDYRKALEVLEVEITKLEAKLNKNRTKDFELNSLQSTLDQTKPLISASMQKLDQIVSEVLACQSTIAKTEHLIQQLDLPNTIDRTTRHLEKMTSELGSLQAQLASSPDKRRYQAAFLPLSAALAKLQLQGQGLEQSAELGTAELELESLAVQPSSGLALKS